MQGRDDDLSDSDKDSSFTMYTTPLRDNVQGESRMLDTHSPQVKKKILFWTGFYLFIFEMQIYFKRDNNGVFSVHSTFIGVGENYSYTVVRFGTPSNLVSYRMWSVGGAMGIGSFVGS